MEHAVGGGPRAARHLFHCHKGQAEQRLILACRSSSTEQRDVVDNSVSGGGGDTTQAEAPSCSQQCTRIFFPVCGSDGATYDNMCLLEIADCESRAAGGPSVIVVSEGACGECLSWRGGAPWQQGKARGMVCILWINLCYLPSLWGRGYSGQTPRRP